MQDNNPTPSPEETTPSTPPELTSTPEVAPAAPEVTPEVPVAPEVAPEVPPVIPSPVDTTATPATEAVIAPTPAEAQVASPAPAAAASTPGVQTHIPGTKNYLVALLLSIFLGNLGIDRFYLGHIGLGIAKLLLNWATLGIWWLIDVILIATRKVKNVTWDDQVPAAPQTPQNPQV